MSFPKELKERYEPIEILGRGANGVVYKTKRLLDGRMVAVKILTASSPDPAAVKRFEREASIAREDLHPGLVQVFESGQLEEIHYIVSELVDGRTLRSFLEHKGPLNTRRTLEIGLEVADCLAKLHAHYIIHRDIKPENIMLDSQGRARLLDLGIAKIAQSGEKLTQTGMLVGTILYLAPEQCRFREAKPTADVFALGLVMLECINPQVLKEGKEQSASKFMLARATGKERLSIPLNVEPAFANMLSKCLAFEPDGRYGDCSILRYELKELLAHPGPPEAELAVTDEIKTVSMPRAKEQKTRPLIAFALLLLCSVLFFVINYSSTPELRYTENVSNEKLLAEYEKELLAFWNKTSTRANSSALRNPPKKLHPHQARMLVARFVRDKLYEPIIGDVPQDELRKSVTRLVGLCDLFQRLPADSDTKKHARAIVEMTNWSRRIVSRIPNCERVSVRKALRKNALSKLGSLARLVDPSELKEFDSLYNELKRLLKRDGERGRDCLLLQLLLVECHYHYRIFDKCQAKLDSLIADEREKDGPERTRALRELAILLVRTEGYRRSRDKQALLDVFGRAVALLGPDKGVPIDEVDLAVHAITISALFCFLIDVDEPAEYEAAELFMGKVLAAFKGKVYKNNFHQKLYRRVANSGNRRLVAKLLPMISSAAIVD